MMKTKWQSDWKTRFWAVVKYELLWNIRKKKFIGVMALALALATLSLALPVLVRNIAGEYLPQNPDYVISTGVGVGGLGMFLFAVAVAMNSISGEFESGSIVPLLTKPVSRTIIFIGKLLAAFITLLAAYASLLLYMAVGGWIIYGPQNNLHLLPLSLLGTLISTFVWIAMVIFIGTLSKSSLLAALGAFGIYMALNISASIISVFTSQAWILNYLPGSGAVGFIKENGTSMSVSTGTDNIASNIIKCVLYPSVEVAYLKFSFAPGNPFTELFREPLWFVLLRSLLVAFAYIIGLLAIAWHSFRHGQVLE
ncbi:ABC transporter permease [Candidatus Bathyarchaeota archaeon]|nr:ABC transporter permease [Candidatus Bathyarchaeota archaeon]